MPTGDNIASGAFGGPGWRSSHTKHTQCCGLCDKASFAAAVHAPMSFECDTRVNVVEDIAAPGGNYTCHVVCIIWPYQTRAARWRYVAAHFIRTLSTSVLNTSHRQRTILVLAHKLCAPMLRSCRTSSARPKTVC